MYYEKTYFAILGAVAILSLATACSSTNVNESTANESSRCLLRIPARMAWTKAARWMI